MPKTVGKKIETTVRKRIEVECVGMQYRLSISTRRFLKKRLPIQVVLKREMSNESDENAIAVYTTSDPDNPYRNMHLGYLRRRVAAVLAPHFDAKRILRGYGDLLMMDEIEGTGEMVIYLAKRRGVKFALDISLG